jgi:hypothetical protein
MGGEGAASQGKKRGRVATRTGGKEKKGVAT